MVKVPAYTTEMYCLLWGTNWVYICYVEESRPPLWSNGFPAAERRCIVSCEVRTKFIFYVEESKPPLWSSGQSSWLQIQRSGFDSQRYKIFWVVGLERGPLSLVSTIEELLERKSSGSSLEDREYGRRDSSRWPGGTLYSEKLAQIHRQAAVARSV
jgi:hypothetical protein